MSTQFKVWVDSPNVSQAGNVKSQSDFNSNSQRANGFSSGETIPAVLFNTILRQNSLICTALMDQFCGSSTVNLASSLADVKLALLNGIASKSALDALSSTVLSHSSTIASHTSSITSLTSQVNSIISSGGTLAAVNMRIDNIVDGTTTVAKAASANTAGKATQDQSGNNIKASYASSMSTSGSSLILKSKDGTTLSTVTIPPAESAAKLGTSTVGSGTKPIFLNNGSPQASSSNVGSGVKPIYMSGGTLTQSASNVGANDKPIFMQNGELKQGTSSIGNANTPVYIENGQIKSTGKDLRKMLTPLSIDVKNFLSIFNFTNGSTYTWSQLNGLTFFNALYAVFNPDDVGAGAFPISLINSTIAPTKYLNGFITVAEYGADSIQYTLNLKDVANDTEYLIRLERTSSYKIEISKKLFNSFIAGSSIVNSYLVVTSSASGTAHSKSISWS